MGASVYNLVGGGSGGGGIPVGLEVSKRPSKTWYFNNETFDRSGMEVRVVYSNDTTKAVTNYTVEPMTLPFGTKEVVLKYTESGRHVSCTLSVEVYWRLVGLIIGKMPLKTEYVYGEYLDTYGMQVLGQYEGGGGISEVEGWTVDTGYFEKAGSYTVTVTYTERGLTANTTFTVKVDKAPDPVIPSVTSLVLTSAQQQRIVTLETKGDGKITARSSDVSCVVVEVRDRSVIITAINTGDATVTVNVAESDDYGASSCLIEVAAFMDPKFEYLGIKAQLSVARGDMAQVELDGKMIYAGGWNGQPVANVDIVDKDLTVVTVYMGTARASIGGCQAGNRAIFGGGRVARVGSADLQMSEYSSTWQVYNISVQDFGALANVETFTSDGVRQSLPDLPQVAAFMGGTNNATFGVLFGGMYINDSKNEITLNTAYVYNEQLSRQQATLPYSVGGACGAEHGEYAIIASGWHTTNYSSGASHYVVETSNCCAFDATMAIHSLIGFSAHPTTGKPGKLGDNLVFNCGYHQQGTRTAGTPSTAYNYQVSAQYKISTGLTWSEGVAFSSDIIGCMNVGCPLRGKFPFLVNWIIRTNTVSSGGSAYGRWSRSIEGSYGMASVITSIAPANRLQDTDDTVVTIPIDTTNANFAGNGCVGIYGLIVGGRTEAGYSAAILAFSASADWEPSPGQYALQDKTVIPTKSQQTILPDEKYYGLREVIVKAIGTEYTDVSGVTAHAEHVLVGFNIVDAAGELVRGQMPNNGAPEFLFDDMLHQEQPIPAGYYSGGKMKLTDDLASAVAKSVSQGISDGLDEALKDLWEEEY